MHRKNILKALALCSASTLAFAASAPALANPEGGQVASGQARIGAAGKKLDVHQDSDRVVIDWRSFDIQADEHTQFHQPSSAAIALNRVGSGQASQINGRLTANGNVVVVNPNGVFFGKDSKVDVNGLIATTADVSNQDFAAGNLRFNKPGKPNAKVVNHGTITAKQAGLVGLVAPTVENHGTITAKLGKVQMASGDSFAVDMYGDGLFDIAVSDNVRSQIVNNTGQIQADGGSITITAAAGREIVNSLITIDGELKAPTIENRGGKIIIAAAGSNGTAKSGNSTVQVGGVIDASGTAKGSRGGKVEVLADQVALKANSSINVSGDAGGGSVKMGGAYQGKGTTQRAKRTYVDREATIKANATGMGNGGEVIVWADGDTRFNGLIEAKGGVNGGNGGFVEVSGKEWLGFQGQVNTSAPRGANGQLLLDPGDIVVCLFGGATCASDPMAQSLTAGGGIFDSGTNNGTSYVDIGTAGKAGSLINLLQSTDVTIQTNAAGTGSGDITIADALTWTTNRNLTFIAHNNINVNAAVTAGGLTTFTSTGTTTVNNALSTSVGTAGAYLFNGPTTFNANVNTSNSAAGLGTITLGNFSHTLGADLITDDSNITINGPVALSGAAGAIRTINAGTGTITTAATGTISGGNRDIVLKADSMALGGTISGTTHLTLTSASSGVVMNIADDAPVGGLNISNAELALLANGFSYIALGDGSVNASSTINIGTWTTVDATYFWNRGTINVLGALNSGPNVLGFYGQDLNINTTTGSVTGGNSIIFTRWGTAGVMGIGTAANNTGYYLTDAELDRIADGGSWNIGGYSATGTTIDVNTAHQFDGYTFFGYDNQSWVPPLPVTVNGALSTKVGSNGSFVFASPTTFNANVNTSNSAAGLGTITLNNFSHTLGADLITDDSDITINGATTLSGAAGVTRTINAGTGTLTTAATGTLTAAAANLALIADTVALGSSVTATAGDLILRPSSNGRAVNVGTAAGLTNFSLDDTELGYLSWGGTLWLGGSNSWNDSGNTTINLTRAFNGNVNFMSGADILFTGGTLQKTGGAANVDWNFMADNSILFSGSADVTASTGSVDVTLNSDRDNSGAGAISLGAGSLITSNGGDITLGGGADPTTDDAMGTASNLNGINIGNAGAGLAAAGGHIRMRGTGYQSVTTNNPIVAGIFAQSPISTTGNGTITLNGTGGRATAGSGAGLIGIWNYIGGTISSQNGAITLTGTAGTSAGATNVYQSGIIVYAPITTNGDGNISLYGTAGTISAGTSYWNAGMDINSAISVTNGDVLLQGQGGTNNNSWTYGVGLYAGASVSSTGTGASAGNITISGTSGSGTEIESPGVLLSWGGATSTISSIDGDISVTGTRPGVTARTDAHGVSLYSTVASSIYTTGDGNLTIQGSTQSASSSGIHSNTVNSIGNAGSTGNITLITDTLNLNSALVRTGGDVTIRPLTAGTTVGIGNGATGSTTLDIGDTLLGNITYGGTLWLGGNNSWNQSGSVLMNTAYTFTKNLTVMSGQDIDIRSAFQRLNPTTASTFRFLAKNGISNGVVGGTDWGLNFANSGGGTLTFNADYDADGAGIYQVASNANIFGMGGSWDVYFIGQDYQSPGLSIIQKTTGTGLNVFMRPSVAGAAVLIGDAGGTAFDLDSDDLSGSFAMGAVDRYTIGDSTTGLITIDSNFEFTDPVTFTSNTGIAVSSALATAAGSNGSFIFNGATTFNANVNTSNSAAGLGTITLGNYSHTLGADLITDDSDITINGATTLSGAAGTTRTINAGTGTLTTGASGSISAASQNLTLRADNMALSSAITGVGGTLTISPTTTSRDMNLGGGVGGLNLDDTELDNLDNGWTLVVFSNFPAYTGNINLAGFDFHTNLYAYTNGSGAITVSGPTTMQGGYILDLATEDGDVDINASLASLGGILQIRGHNADQTVGLAGGSGDITLSVAELDNIANGWSSISFGNGVRTAITMGAYSNWRDPITFAAGSFAGVEGAISVNGDQSTAVGSNASFTFNGATTFNGNVNTSNSAAGLGTIALGNYSHTLGADLITDDSDITINGATTLSGAAGTTRIINAGTGAITTGASGTLASGNKNLVLQSDGINLGANLSGTGALTLRPTTSGRSMGINGTSGSWSLSPAEIARLQNGFSGILIDSNGGNSVMRIGMSTWRDPVTFRTRNADLIVEGRLTSIDASGDQNKMILATEGRFRNTSGLSSPFSLSGGRYLVYSYNPSVNLLGSLIPSAERYSSTYAGYGPGSVTELGNLFLYAIAGSSTPAPDPEPEPEPDPAPSGSGSRNTLVGLPSTFVMTSQNPSYTMAATSMLAKMLVPVPLPAVPSSTPSGTGGGQEDVPNSQSAPMRIPGVSSAADGSGGLVAIQPAVSGQFGVSSEQIEY